MICSIYCLKTIPSRADRSSEVRYIYLQCWDSWKGCDAVKEVYAGCQDFDLDVHWGSTLGDTNYQTWWHALKYVYGMGYNMATNVYRNDTDHMYLYDNERGPSEEYAEEYCNNEYGLSGCDTSDERCTSLYKWHSNARAF